MRNPKFPFQCLIASWLIGIVGLLLGLFIEPDYFSRFGSLVVLFAVASEYALLQSELQALYQSLRGQGATVAGGKGIPDLSPSPWHKKQAIMSHVTIVIGTFIWGFGDIFI